jgi:hypothetical protein
MRHWITVGHTHTHAQWSHHGGIAVTSSSYSRAQLGVAVAAQYPIVTVATAMYQSPLCWPVPHGHHHQHRSPHVQLDTGTVLLPRPHGMHIASCSHTGCTCQVPFSVVGGAFKPPFTTSTATRPCGNTCLTSDTATVPCRTGTRHCLSTPQGRMGQGVTGPFSMQVEHN